MIYIFKTKNERNTFWIVLLTLFFILILDWEIFNWTPDGEYPIFMALLAVWLVFFKPLYIVVETIRLSLVVLYYWIDSKFRH